MKWIFTIAVETVVLPASVVSIGDEKVILSAPLPPNINHRSTVFGGSISTIATLAA